MSGEVRRTKRELVYEGAILKVYQDTMEFANGNSARWDYIHHVGAAAVVPVLDDGRILMVRQYRNALERDTLEIPAGKLDVPGEPGIECSRRELEEETGYQAGTLDWLITIRPTVAYCDERIEIFVARGLTASRQNLDENEYVDVRPYELSELKEMIFDGRIEDSKTVAALLAYESRYLR
ncbi:NUDIX domain-containing protein [Extibacter muris]|uniref:NUDIX domain-containing protein n=1 Tax=Extibacter muris TaxID=1796622 RepID=UPI001D08BABC|nr:NUDIX hydrolase [Extibacter muris]MCB6200302.1 NUDIX hydrolase [Extibacter muris]MCQ4663806.1 NUDIX hydrolase [Extibacter muris]MCQ4695098.1 NUDIX hydrolase [Extibacter muris]